MHQDIPKFAADRFAAVAISSSTGAPCIVRTMLASLPADLPVPIFVGQHLPPQFSASFAAQCDREAAISVFHAEDGMPVLPGVAYVGAGHQHLRVVKPRFGGRITLEVSPEPKELLYKPSGDELLRTCAAIYGRKTLAIVLSGIGHDGVHGAKAVIDAGGMLLTQRRDTCAVYGMPRACDEAGLTTASLTPEQITQALQQLGPRYVAA